MNVIEEKCSPQAVGQALQMSIRGSSYSFAQQDLAVSMNLAIRRNKDSATNIYK
jgi:hypothetical protein